MVIRIVCLCAFFLPMMIGYGQSSRGLIAYYSFDDGTATDNAGNSNGVLSDNPPQITCGVAGNALRFNGEDNHVDLLGTVTDGDYFRELGQFTISLFFKTDNPFGTHDILSKRQSCSAENAFALRYTPSARALSVELIENNERMARFIHRVEEGTCWIHVAITKTSNSQQLWVNGEFIEDARIMGNLDLSTDAVMKIADSPCLGTTDRRFSGAIDELRIFNRVLREDELRSLYLVTDQIQTPDTTIYVGDDLTLVAGETCAPSISWSPVGSLDQPFAPTTRAAPANTTTYQLEFEYTQCTAVDTVLVRVIDPTDIDCGSVPMANAFTPNDDGRNDEYFISNPFSIQNLDRFEVFDKWGNRVFATSNVSDRWDGSYRGERVMPGIYIYKIRYNCGGEDLTATGSVMVLH